MNIQFSVLVNSAKAGCAVVLISAGLLTPDPALSNGLGENVPFRFTHKDKLKMLEMQQLKESGFYDSQAGAGGAGAGGGGDTIIYGDQINCSVQSTALANSNNTQLDATTGSMTGVSEADIGSDAGANDSESWNDGDGNLDIGQENSGNQNASVTDSNISSDVGTFNGGGTSSQNTDTYQSADNSILTSTIDDVTVCDNLTVN